MRAGLLCSRPRRAVSPWRSPASRSAGAILLGAASPGTAAPSSGIVVNEVYGGGGNSGATYTNDFIELRNRGTAAVSLDGWSVQYHSGSATGAWQVTPLSGSIAPGAIYLVAEATGTGGTQPLPPPQATGTIAMSAHGRARSPLVNGTTALTCQRLGGLPERRRSTSSATAPRSSARRPRRAGASNTASVQRKDAADTDNNAADFAAAAPTPGAANAGGGGGGTRRRRARPAAHPRHPGLELARRRTTASRSPTCPASSPRVRTSGSSRGYWIQDPDAGRRARPPARASSSSPRRRASRSATRSSCPARSSDFYPLSSGDTVADDLEPVGDRDRHARRVIVRSHGNALPGARGDRARHGARHATPRTSAAPTSSRRRSRRPARRWTSGSRARACACEVDDARVVGPSNDFGEQFVTTKPTQADDLPRRHRDPGRERHPLGPRRGRAGRRQQPRRQRRRRVHRRDRRARSTTRSSAAT